MGLSLLNPLLALGAIGVAAPIIIHFLFRRKSTVVKFSAMRFVLLSYKKVARRLLVQEYLLLAARCLMVLLLALALAGPLITRAVQSFARGDKPLAVAFVLDTSLSMTRKKGDKLLLDAGKERIEDWAGRLMPGDKAMVIDACRLEGGEMADDFAEVAGAARDMEPSSRPARMNAALALARSRTAALSHLDAVIVVVTDMQRTSWSGPSENAAGTPPLLIIDVAEGMDSANLSVSSIDISRKSLVRQEAGEVTVTVTNHGEEDSPRALLRLLSGGEVLARGFVEVPARESLAKTFVVTDMPEGAGSAELEADDGLAADNKAYFHTRGGTEVRALVVDGDPGTGYLESETYFLDQALDPRLYAKSRVKPRTITLAELADADLAEYQALVLANAGKVEPATAAKVKDFVNNGGGLFITMGDNVDADAYNAIWGELLPREPRGTKLSYAGALGTGEVRVKHIETPTFGPDTHPALQIFGEPGQGDLGLAGFRKYFLVQQEIVPKTRVLLRLTDGTPILVEGRYGRGKVMLFTSTIDREWNDLCIHPTYLPLMQQVVQYLGDALALEDEGRLIAGSIVELPLTEDVVAAEVTSPSEETEEAEVIDEEGARRARFSNTSEPGVYRVRFRYEGGGKGRSGGDIGRVLVLNLDPAESDLTRIEPEAIESLAGVDKVALVGAETTLAGVGAEGREKKSYAGLLLALLALAAVGERALIRR